MAVMDRTSEILSLVNSVGFSREATLDPSTNIDYTEQSREFLKLFLLNQQTRSKLIEIDGLKIDFIFSPNQISISKNSDDGKFVASTTGDVSLLMSRLSDGQTLIVNRIENMSYQRFASLPLQDCALLARKARGYKAFIDGLNVNELGFGGIPPRLSRSNQMEVGFLGHKDMQPVEKSLFFSPSFHLDGSKRFRGKDPFVAFDMLEKNLMFKIELIASSEQLSVCDELGVYLTDKNKIIDFVEESRARDFEHSVRDLNKIRNERIAHLGIPEHQWVRPMSGLTFSEANDYDPLYPEPVLNYFAAGDSPAAMKYRKEFVDKTYEFLFGNFKDARYLYKDNSFLRSNDGNKNLFSILLNQYLSRNVVMQKCIDSGRYPSALIAQKMGFPNLNKGQFKNAMLIAGRGNALASSNRVNFGLEHLPDCFSLSKIDPKWFKVSDEMPDIRTSAFLNTSIGNNLKNMFPYLINLGRNLEQCAGTGDKRRGKELVSQWNWLGKNEDLGFLDKWNSLETKYNINATLNDYPRLIHQSFETILFRVLQDTRLDIPSDVLSFERDESALTIDFAELTSALKEVARASDYDSWLEDQSTPNHERIEAYLVNGDESDLVWNTPRESSLTAGEHILTPIASYQDLKRYVPEHKLSTVATQCIEGEAAIFCITDDGGEFVALAYLDANDDEWCNPIYYDTKWRQLDGPSELTNLFFEGAWDLDCIDPEHSVISDVRDVSGWVYGDEDFDSVEMEYEDIPDIGVYEINRLLRSSVTNFKEILEKNEKWHHSASAFSKEVNQLDKSNNLSWVGLINEPHILSEDYYIESISNRIDLLNEGTSMSHCVFSYFGACMSGESTILSVKSMDGEREATVELVYELDDDERVFEVNQCFGYENQRVSEELNGLVETFVESINQGRISVNPELGGDEDGLEDILSLVEDDPLNKGYLIKEAPYNTAAAHLTYFNLESMLPKGTDVSSLVGGIMGELGMQLFFTENDFIDEIRLIEGLSAKLDMPPIEIVRLAIAHDLPKFENVEMKVNEIKTITTLVDGLKMDNPQLTARQLAMLASSSLVQAGLGDYSVESLTEALETKDFGETLAKSPLSMRLTEQVELGFPELTQPQMTQNIDRRQALG